MKIAQINNMYTNKSVSGFKGRPHKARPMVSEQTPDNEIVCYSNWGGNYVFPIYAKDIKQMEQAKHETKPETRQVQKQFSEMSETPEEYYKRKLYSTEWCM